jgi:hypothetical protein
MIAAEVIFRDEIRMLYQRQHWEACFLRQIEPVIAFFGQLMLEG